MLNMVVRYLICLFCLKAGAVYGLAPSFETVLSDTAPGEIKAILQDSQGFMWFGGRNALLRFNAYKYQNIQAIEEKGTERKNVSPYYVTDIFQDSAGTLWITSHSGLYIFDADQEILVRPKTIKDITDPIFLGALQSIKELPSGELMVGGDGSGLAIFDKKTFEIHWKQVDTQREPESATAVSNRTIQRLLIDSQNRIWIANNLGLNLFDYVAKTFSLYIPNPENPGSKVDNALLTLAEDSSGNILGGTLGKGLYVFNPRTRQFRHYINNPADPHSLPDDGIWKILIDSDKKIWLGLTRSGFSHFDSATETFTRVDYAYGQPGALAYSATRSLYEDKNKNIWIGHYPAKVSFHNRSAAAIGIYRKNTDNPNAMSDNNVQRVMEDKQGNIWMAVGDGVNVLERKSEKVKRYNEKLGNYPAHGSLSGYVDRENGVWIGTWIEGFSKLNRRTDRFESMPTSAAAAAASEKQSRMLNDATVWGFCETSDNALWLGTHYAGISRFDSVSGIFTKYRSENTDTTIANNIVWTCFEDKQGRFWMGTAYGLSVMDKVNETFKNYKPQVGDSHGLRAGSVEDIYQDAKGRVWFATNGGLHRYREETDDFEVFTTDDGFINNGIRALTGDRIGNIWLGTNNGIIRFNPETRKTENYQVSGGNTFGGVNSGAALTSSAGEVIFGTTDGLVVIDVEKLTTNTQSPPVVLTDFKIFARSASLKDTDSVLKKVVNQSEQLVLDYTKRMFSFEFAALNFRDADKNRYAYKLEGFDLDWREIGTSREAQYTNLNPGTYVFKVKASNNDGVWSENPKSIVVVQLPPPWKSWWAYTIYVLLFLSIVAYFVYLQKRKQFLIEEQNRLLEIKVAERTFDLAEKNRDIQALLGHMRQGLFTVDESGSIHHEYSAFLESIFETQSIAGRNMMDLLFEHAALDTDRIGQVAASVFSIIGSDEMNFALNAHLLIDEYKVEVNSHKKVISLDWNPILDSDQNVLKLMVSVRDVTELKSLEQEALIKKRELDIVARLLSIPSDVYANYRASTARFIDESKQLVQSAAAFEQPVIQKLFRTMHTIKGNSRTHGFSHIASAAHDAESFYGKLSGLTIDKIRTQLYLDLNTVADVLAEYNQVYTQILGRNEDPQHRPGGVWVSQLILNAFHAKVEELKQIAPDSYRSILTTFNQLYSAGFSEAIKPVLDSLPAIAEELGKYKPRVHVDDGGIKIKVSARNLLQDIFTHLLRNSLDHGLESAESRRALNKDPTGTISIVLEPAEHILYINVSDDGGGLNLNRLYQQGLRLGLFGGDKILQRLHVANSIFTSGLSTKKWVDSISGRGVGMDAVKQFLIEFGGDITIVIPDPAAAFVPSQAVEPVDFVLRVQLPREKCVAE